MSKKMNDDELRKKMEEIGAEPAKKEERTTGIRENSKSSSAVKEDMPSLQEQTRMLTAPISIWLVVMSLWSLGVILLLKYPLALLGYIVMLIALLYWDFTIVKENERAKPVFLGQIKKITGSGPVFILRPLEKLLRYPTGVQQITFAPAGILTKTKNGLESVVLPVIPVLNFQWPWDDNELTIAIKNAPPPNKEGLKELVNQLEEPFLDLVRTVGGELSYEEISQKRVQFAEDVTKKLRESKDLTKLIESFRLKNSTVSMKHIKLPKTLEEALEERASAKATGEAAGIIERETRIGIADGEKVKRERILDVMERYPESGLTVEALITLREMAESGKTTHFVMPSEVYGALTRALGAPVEQVVAGMGKKEFGKLIEKLRKLE